MNELQIIQKVGAGMGNPNSSDGSFDPSIDTSASDALVLKKLDPFILFYQNAIREILKISVPPNAVVADIALLNSYNTSLLADQSFRNYSSSPSLAFASLNGYMDILKKSGMAFKKFDDLFSTNGLVFSQTDRSYHPINPTP